MSDATTLGIEPLLTVPQVAEVLGTSRTFIYSQMDSGKLPYCKLGKCRRIRRADLGSYIEASVTGGFALPSKD